MHAYIVKRLALAAPTLLGVVTAVFLALHLAPGDPINLMIPADVSGEAREELVARIKAQYGLDQPLHIQYLNYIKRVLQLDFGRSLRNRTLVIDDLASRVPNTLQLGILALVIAVVIGIPAGIISAARRDSLLDNIVMAGALFGVSVPNFWLGFMLMLAAGLYLDILPPSGYGGPIYRWEGLRYAILPALTLGSSVGGVLARFTRSSMLEVIGQDYIRTARAKGLSERVVLFRHALKNALLPVVTVLGVQFGTLLSGAVIVETVFAWPGIGRYMVSGITARDFPVVQAAVMVVAAGFVLANLLTDLAYAYIDPRIRYD